MLRRGPLACATVVSLALSLVPFGPLRALASSPGVVISQVYGGGGNSGAQYTNDFIELFNRGAATVSLSGWSLQYASATGTGSLGANAAQLTELSGSIPAGGYLLVQEAAGAGNGVTLPTPDVTDATPISMSASGGKVALVSTATPLGCNGGSTPCTAAALAQIVDLVGYDGATFFEGAAPAPTLSNTTAALRLLVGCQDTDNNGADFAAGAPAPRNSTAPPHPCPADPAPSVVSTDPANGASEVAVDANISITFSEPVNVMGSWYSISCTTSGTHAAITGGGPVTFTLDPATDFVPAESCTVTVAASGVADQDLLDPPDNMAADYALAFMTPVPPTFIHDIQGVSHISPLVGRTLGKVPGIVTAKRSNGFYLEDPSPDASDATSEGIFVFTGSAPSSVSVGDAVTVRGRVSEFRPGGSSSGNLTTTELVSPAVTVLSRGNALPAAVVIGVGGRMPPTSVIEDDAAGSVETGGVFDPASDGIDFYESLEGMLVRLDHAVAVGPTNAFGETAVIGDDGSWASPRTPRGGIQLTQTDGNPERLIADDAIVSLPAMNVGDRYSGPIVGALDYNFGNFFIEVTQPVGRLDGGLAREVAAGAGPGQLAIATFNVENLDPGDGAAKFDRLAHLIVDNLRSPDLIAVEEVQDNDGAVDHGIVDASDTLGTLVAAISSAGGPAYEWRGIDPVNDQDGGEPGGNIRQVFLFRGDRGLSFIDRPGATSMTANAVTGAGSGTRLAYSPGRIDPTNAAFNNSRKPLAGEFSYRGEHLFVVANHFNSKGGDDPLFGRFQPPRLSSEVQRLGQARIVHDFVAAILAADAAANVVVLGDLNDFVFSAPLATLTAGVLHDLVTTLPLGERYTYVFDGNSQDLDHILVSDALFARGLDFDVVHVNAEFADQASDHDPGYVRLAPASTAGRLTGGARTRTDAHASFIVSSDGSTARGEVEIHAGDLTVHTADIVALGISGNAAWVTATSGAREVLVYAEDDGEPGAKDILRIWIDGALVTSGPLIGGNIQLHGE